MGVDIVGGLERAGMRLHGLGVSVEVKGAGGTWVDKLFGVGGELAWDGTSEGVQGERQRLVLKQLRSRDGGRRTGEHPLGGRHADRDAGVTCRPGPAALLHLGRAKFSGGEAGGGEGDGLGTGSGESGEGVEVLEEWAAGSVGVLELG